MKIILMIIGFSEFISYSKDAQSQTIPKSLSSARVHKIYRNCSITLSFLWRCDPTRVMVSSFTRFLDHAQRRATVGRTPLDE
jgi:hypothetical protein